MMTSISHRGLATSLVAAALFAAPSTAEAGGLTLTTDQPAYEVAQTITLTITGPVGASTTLLIDLDDGPTFVPGYGEFALGFSPFFLMADLGPIPASGEIVLSIPLLCRFAPPLGIEVYLQAVAFDGGAPILSNPWHFAESPGDCDNVCESGIEQMGVQTTFANVPATGKLSVSVSRPNGQQTVYGTLDVNLDLAVDATGVLDVPLVNGDSSITVSMLEMSGSSLTVRFCLDATVTPGKKLQGGETTFAAAFEGTSEVQQIHTSCSIPLAVGDVHGNLTITKLVFKD